MDRTQGHDARREDSAPASGALDEFDEICELLTESSYATHIVLEDLAELAERDLDRQVVDALASVRLSHATMVLALQRGIHALLERVDRLERGASPEVVAPAQASRAVAEPRPRPDATRPQPRHGSPCHPHRSTQR